MNDSLREYRVKYEIDVSAKSPYEAALEVVDILNESAYHSTFTIIDQHTRQTTEVDLNVTTDQPIGDFLPANWTEADRDAAIARWSSLTEVSHPQALR